jgi:predicted DNA-binding transcriptional regulator AlpA
MPKIEQLVSCKEARARLDLSAATFWCRCRDPKAIADGFPRPINIGGRRLVRVCELHAYIANLIAKRDE